MCLYHRAEAVTRLLNQPIYKRNMEILTPHFPAKIRATVALPTSKSLCNRALLLCAMSGKDCRVSGISDCDDTRVMLKALEERLPVIDILAAGTAMRFLTAYLAACKGEEHVITGTQRMKERPISVLVDALRELGAEVSYTGNEGFPPLRIRGKRLKGGCLNLPGHVSSQYISALLMIGPNMDEGLELTLEGEVISRPYIDMTLAMMKAFGAQAEWTGNQSIRVLPTGYKASVDYQVESDWSAASYWYEAMALTDDADARIVLPGLQEQSLQGDHVVRELFCELGVQTAFTGQGAVLAKVPGYTRERMEKADAWERNLNVCPDLAQTLVVTCAMLRRKFRFTGLCTLRIKETDRLAALSQELSKFGIAVDIEGDDALSVLHYPEDTPRYDGRAIDTYHDHRMALAFAPAALVCPGIRIAEPAVVTKSYPTYWEDINRLHAIL